ANSGTHFKPPARHFFDEDDTSQDGNKDMDDLSTEKVPDTFSPSSLPPATFSARMTPLLPSISWRITPVRSGHVPRACPSSEQQYCGILPLVRRGEGHTSNTG